MSEKKRVKEKKNLFLSRFPVLNYLDYTTSLVAVDSYDI